MSLSPPIAAPRSDEVLIRLDQAERVFRMGEVVVPALHPVSLEIYRGELIVMVGPSGSGKTTLLNLIGGMDRPSGGKAFFRQQELTTLSPAGLTRYRRETIGFVFQFYNLIANLTALENVQVATEISRDPISPIEALRMVGLEARRDHFPSQLSGGEQQRVAIARAIAKNPDVLLCDEPTGALDFETGKRILSLLIELRDRLGKTVIIITHNVAIGEIADRVLRLRSGEIVERHVNDQPKSPEEISW